MSSDLLSIAKSGVNAARLALDVTSQNIANAGTDGYVRRSVTLDEVVATTSPYSTLSDYSLAGVRVGAVVRSADVFRTAEVRRTTGDLARADAELGALNNVEGALEQSGISDALSAFQSALQSLKADPTNPALRATVLENARTLADSFNAAAGSLTASQASLTSDALAGVSQINQLAGDLTKINTRLLRSADGSSDQANLLDQRDKLLQSMSQLAGVSVSIGDHGVASVAIDGVSLVAPTGATAVAATANPDGSLAFSIGGSPVAISAGSLAGTNLGLVQLTAAKTRLDAIAGNIVSAVNGAQASGVALDGSAGQPLFAGTTAADIQLVATDGKAIATAAAGSAADSRNPANLTAMIAALDGSGAAAGYDQLMTDVSSAVAARGITRDSLKTIADGATAALAGQAGVSLDDEAANLLRFQQAYQASGRIMQVAKDLFDTLIAIR